jgi:hypothetical protein
VSSQGANNNAGQGSRPTFVSFTKAAAIRINDAVLTVEKGNRNQPGLRFDHPQFGASGKFFRVCTYTGSWSVGSSKTVTFKYQTATPNTAVATNLFFPVTGTASADCAIAKDGTAWFLIDVPFYTATSILVTGTASSSFVTDVSLSAALNTNNCVITIGKTLTTSTSVIVTTTASASYISLARP